MHTSTLDSASQAPDLLQRFVPTPFEGAFAIGKLDVFVHSNDRAIVELLAPTPVQRQDGQQSFLWKLIYDSEAPSEIGSLTLLQCDRTAVANLGPGCLVAVDYDRGKLIAFVGLHGGNPTFREAVIPLLTAMTLQAANAPFFQCNRPEQKFAAVGGSHE